MIIYPRYFFLILLILFNCFSREAINLETLYGNFKITEPVLQDILHDKFFCRLNNIRQYGVDYYAIKNSEYTRAQHSIGVLALLIRYHAPLNEQIAGLLHDVSHTVFSHVGDLFFNHKDGKNSYQDEKHLWFLTQTTLPQLLKKYHLTIHEIDHKRNGFTRLEQDLPDICADRLEYNLMGGVLESIITQQECLQILDDLHFENGKWFFTKVEGAKKFAQLSLYLTENVWASAEGLLVDYLAADLLKKAVLLDLISLNDIHFSTDDVIWQKLVTCDDPEIQLLLKQLLHQKSYFTVVTENEIFDFHLKGKFRGIDPLVKKNDNFYRLTQLDPDYCKKYNAVNEKVKSGYFFKKQHLN